MIKDTLSTLHGGRSTRASEGGTCLLIRKIIKKVSAVLTSGDKVNETTSIMQYIKNNEETKTQYVVLMFFENANTFPKRPNQ